MKVVYILLIEHYNHWMWFHILEEWKLSISYELNQISAVLQGWQIVISKRKMGIIGYMLKKRAQNTWVNQKVHFAMLPAYSYGQ